MRAAGGAVLFLVMAGACVAPVTGQGDGVLPDGEKADGDAMYPSRYVPYRFVAPELVSRDALGERFSVAVRPEAPIAVSTLLLGPVELSFFSEVSEVLGRVASHTTVPEPGIADVPVSCEEHSRPLMSVGELQISSDPSCTSAADLFGEVLENVPEVCHAVTEPVRFIKEQDPTGFDSAKLRTLEGLIQVAVRPFVDLDVPLSILTPEFRKTASQILIKVRYEALTAGLEAQMGRYDAARDALEAQRPCFPRDIREMLAPRLAALRAELESVQRYLDQLDEEGRARAEEQRQAVLDAGRCRERLPYPSLTDEDREFLALYLGAVYWRMRGGVLWSEQVDTTRERRQLFNAAPLEELGELMGGDYGHRVGAAIHDHIYRGWVEWWDMGHHSGDAFEDLVGMTRRGEYQVEAGLDVLRDYGFGKEELAIGGLQMGPCYYRGWEELLGADVRIESFIGGGATEWGEVCTGGAISLGMTRALLAGRDCYTQPRIRD